MFSVIFWVYIPTAPDTWTVGFYDPQKKWHPESDHESSESAAARVHYLNGDSPLRSRIAATGIDQTRMRERSLRAFETLARETREG